MFEFETLDIEDITFDDEIVEIIKPLKPEESYIEKIIKENPSLIKERHYLDNEIFKQELLSYQLSREKALSENKPEPQIPNNIGIAFLTLCENLSRRHNFINYTYRDEMVSAAIESCVKAAKTFKVTEGKTLVFTYFTYIAFFAMVRIIKSEKREHQIKKDLIGDIHIKTSIVQEMDSANEYSSEMRDNFISLYNGE